MCIGRCRKSDNWGGRGVGLEANMRLMVSLAVYHAEMHLMFVVCSEMVSGCNTLQQTEKFIIGAQIWG